MTQVILGKSLKAVRAGIIICIETHLSDTTQKTHVLSDLFVAECQKENS